MALSPAKFIQKLPFSKYIVFFHEYDQAPRL